ncbi:hypothetical protein [Streptomyces puniciscabiei]|uniref:hypothetical protein n=1 Tax=Streptomyces puniciscabiei TaxID=164348 RepID=UPI0037B68197
MGVIGGVLEDDGEVDRIRSVISSHAIKSAAQGGNDRGCLVIQGDACGGEAAVLVGSAPGGVERGLLTVPPAVPQRPAAP